jgi:hypothetical protein
VQPTLGSRVRCHGPGASAPYGPGGGETVPVQAAVIALEAYGISRGHLEDVDPFVPMIIGLRVFGIGGAVMLAIAAACAPRPARDGRGEWTDGVGGDPPPI